MRLSIPFFVCAALSFSLPSTFVAAAAFPPGIAPFAGVDPALPDDDLVALLDPVIHDASVVAIGESMHGSGGYLRLQHRILRYLVERKEFRVFVLESPVLRSEALSAALAKCTSAPLPIDRLYDPEDADLALFEWIRDFNCRHPKDPVVFRGIDIWDRPWELQAKLAEYGAVAGYPDLEAKAAVVAAKCYAQGLKSWDEVHGAEAIIRATGKIPSEMRVPCQAALDAMTDWANAEAVRRPRDPVVYRFLQVLQTITALQDYSDYRFRSFGEAWNGRDRGQARNVYQVRREYGLDRKLVWITHTSHSSHMRSPSDWWKLGYGAFRSAVSFFEEAYATPVVNIMETSYHATGSQGDWADPISPDSLDLALHRMESPYLAVDPKSAFVRAKPRWWVQNENQDDPGTYRDGVFMVPEDNFDLFLFVDETLKDTPILPWHDAWEW